MKNTQRMAKGSAEKIFADQGCGFLKAPAGHGIYFHRASMFAARLIIYPAAGEHVPSAKISPGRLHGQRAFCMIAFQFDALLLLELRLRHRRWPILFEKALNLSVRHLPEVKVPFADRGKRPRSRKANALVRLIL